MAVAGRIVPNLPGIFIILMLGDLIRVECQKFMLSSGSPYLMGTW